MDDRLKGLMKELRILAEAGSAGSDASVELFEGRIYEYLSDLRKAVRDEKAKKPAESGFWMLVEEYIDRLKPDGT